MYSSDLRPIWSDPENFKMGGGNEGQTYCLRWNNHKSNLVEILEVLIKVESYVDCTIVVDEQVSFKAHRVILAANSPYFQAILSDVPMDHCSILFPGVKEFEMRALLEYMYTGEVNVTQAQIPRIMKVAEQLEVKGLFDMSELRRNHSRPGDHTPAASPPLVAPAAPSAASPPAPLPLLSSAYDNVADMNPLKRKKLSSLMAARDTPILRNVLAQSAADSSQPVALVCHPVQPRVPPAPMHVHHPALATHAHVPHPPQTLSNGSAHEDEKFNRSDRSEDAFSPYTDKSFDEEARSYQQSPPPHTFAADLRLASFAHAPLTPHSGHAQHPSSQQQKPEWKRYKQYTRSDIMSAIECVRNGMSALQASRKFGVPSRTLYDKVKKMGITTSRPMHRATKREHNGASFPYGATGTDDSVTAGAGALLDASFLQQALENREGGREALHAMALAAAARALAPCAPSPRSPPPAHLAAPADHEEEDRVEDLSVSRRPMEIGAGVIVPPRARLYSQPLDCSERD